MAVSSATVEAPALAMTSCALAIPFRQVAEEGPEMRGDSRLAIGVAEFRQILLAGLLLDGEPPAHAG